MPYIKLDDGFFRNPKIMRVSRDAKFLYIAGLCYSGSALTDGFVPDSAPRSLAADADIGNPTKAIKQLVAAGLWVETEGGYTIHDYLEHNTSSDQVRAKREAAKERMQRARSRNVRANNERSSHEVREPETEIETETETPSSEELGREGSADADPPQPKPEPKPAVRGSRLPDNFQPSDEERSKFKRAFGMTDEMLDFETEKFRDYWIAQPGQHGVKLDWLATWRNWIRRSREYGRTNGSQPRNMAVPDDGGDGSETDWVGDKYRHLEQSAKEKQTA